MPGLNAVIAGATLAALRASWEVVGVHDGFDGVLFPEEYADGGVMSLDRRAAEALPIAGSALGTGARRDPFRIRAVTADNAVKEVDRSDELLARLSEAGVKAVIAVVGGSAITGSHAMSVAFRLHRKGLPIVCIPKSVENDIAVTSLAFGYDSALGYATDALDRIRAAARDVRRLAVVEVPGAEAGWLALQAGLAARADAVLIPEIPYDIPSVARMLRRARDEGHPPSLVVVAQGATSREAPGEAAAPVSGLRKSLSPLSDLRFGEGGRVIDRSGAVAEALALELQRSCDIETVPLNLDHLVRTGTPSALDRQLGLAYGAGAVDAIEQGRPGSVMAFQPPHLGSVPLAEALNRVRRVPLDGDLVRTAAAIGLCLGHDKGAGHER
ncbi:6-phosphofructokinase [Alsobacter sp. SYSU M60028]|uniref:6-phosphofructokinase n=1 Tax=Alsobacter ponti TaxID=2962936 RepID=A0ABT1LD31_9HYPH|nr:6-phosphofructokinase [Alsobacter ponti]